MSASALTGDEFHFFKFQCKFSTMVDTFNSSAPEAEAGGLQVQSQPGLHSDFHEESMCFLSSLS